MFVKLFSPVGPYLRKAPIILDKPDIVYVVENQPASITITLNHVHAVVAWKRLVCVTRSQQWKRLHTVCRVLNVE